MIMNFNTDLKIKSPRKINLSDIFFTSDLHFFHKNILEYCPSRGCQSVEKMNEKLILNWNKKIKPHSSVFVLGDVLFGNSEERISLLHQLNGIKYLIPGNHDLQVLKKQSFCGLWQKILPELTHLRLFNYFLVLCHFPIASWLFQERNSIHLHGHCHGMLKWDSSLRYSQRLDVGVDNHEDLSPWSFLEILNLLEQRTRECQTNIKS